MTVGEPAARAQRVLRLLAELAEKTARIGDMPAYCARARQILAASACDFPFVELNPLDGDGESASVSRWPIPMMVRAQHGQSVRRDGMRAWLSPLVGPGGTRPFAVLGLGEGWDDDEPLLSLIAHQLARGIDDPRQAEQRTQDRLMRALFHDSPVPISVCAGPEHRYQIANRSYLAMVNRGPEIIGRTIGEVWPETVGTPLLEVFERTYRTGEPYVTDDYVVRLDLDHDGSSEECVFSFNLVAVRDEAGAVCGIACTAQNITAHVLARRETQLAHQQAEQASRARDDFLALLGHELRNPLTPITASLYLMEKRGGETFQAERSIIQRQVDHLVRLVDNLLDVSRLTAGRIRLQRVPVELSVVVQDALEASSALLLERAQRLTVHVPPRGLVVMGDHHRLVQAVSNLLINAAKYSPDGSAVTIEGRARDGRAILTVRDRGVGIGAEVLPRIFELFVQGRQALDRARGGLGIGLAVVHGILSAHDGSVRAHSDGLGTGSAFEVELPLASTAELDAWKVPRSSAPPPPARPRLPVRILVVDDNRDAALTLATVLRELGQEVELAYDASMALRLAPSFAPVLALLDIGLPGIDGYSLAVQLRAQLPERVRLVAVTGYGQPSDRERAFAAGFDAHVVKPLRIDAVESILEDLYAELEHAHGA